jgi:aryl-alcohol dehydrogenase-like predicted oxidoreductase
MKLFGMGLGLAALGRPGYINLGHSQDLRKDYSEPAMEQRAHEIMDEAHRLGVRYFDAARSYGKAEKFLSTWLAKRELLPGEVIVGSKWGYRYTANWQVNADKHEVKEHTVAQLNRQLPESRALLGDHLGLYQIHSATLESNVLADNNVLNMLAKLKWEGIAVGFTTTGERQRETIEYGLRVKIDGVRLFDTVQVTYNLLERSAEPALHAAKSAGLQVIVKEAVANGRLTPRAELHPALVAEAARLGTTVDAVAIAFALQRPFVDLVLSGAATLDQVRSNLNAPALAKVRDLDEVKEPPSMYWRKRASLAWN